MDDPSAQDHIPRTSDTDVVIPPLPVFRAELFKRPGVPKAYSIDGKVVLSAAYDVEHLSGAIFDFVTEQWTVVGPITPEAFGDALLAGLRQHAQFLDLTARVAN